MACASNWCKTGEGWKLSAKKYRFHQSADTMPTGMLPDMLAELQAATVGA
jgi:hypothetical protein